MSGTDVAAGGRLRDRVGTRAPATVFAILGVGLVAAGFAVPDVATLLFAWGGTALFVALLVRVVFTGPTVSGAVATDIYAALAGNARRRAGSGSTRYVPDEDGVALAVDGERFDPVGVRLLAAVEMPETDGTIDDCLAVIADVLVNDLELAARVSARRTDDGATVRVTGSRVGTTELFDHPVTSAVGVALAGHLDGPVRVDAAVEADAMVVDCRFSEGSDELLDGAQADEDGEDEAADQ